jgi:hypothetical protein
MSRYDLEPFQPTEEVVIGWDRILRSYFAHVIDTTKDEDDEGRDILRIGCSLDEIHDVELVVKRVQAHATVPYKVWHQLYMDSARE